MFKYKNKNLFQFNLIINDKPKKGIEKHVELLLVENERNFHYVFIKNFNRIVCNKVKHKDKNILYLSFLLDFNSLDVLQKHRKFCLEINNKQNKCYAKWSRKICKVYVRKTFNYY